MNTFLRILESGTTYQDYAWFLAALAWLVVALGASRRTREQTAATGDQTWLVVFATGAIAGAVLELVLCAQNLSTPYTNFDFAMGFAQAVSVAALCWPALERRWPVGAVRVATLIGAGLLAGARVAWPGVAGTALVIVSAAAAWIATRVLLSWAAKNAWDAGEQRGLRWGMTLVGLLPAIATHGPLALAAGEPRIRYDFSHFALLAAGVLLASGALVALALWRWRLRSLHGRAELNRGVALLALWLVAGLAFAVWSGRQARRGFEEDMLRRTRTGAALLDAELLRAALGPELQITSFRLRHDPDGKTVEMARIANGKNPPNATLRRALAQMSRANPDVASIFIEVIRGDRVIVPCTRKVNPDNPEECVVYRPATALDIARLAAKLDFFEGPVTNEWGTHFYERATLLDATTNQPLGWLVMDASGTRWTLSFTQARLQAMALVGLGVGLWGLAIAYRMRRAESVAAEQRAAAAAEADRMKSTFLAKVSHELRTPIQSVLGYCELLTRVPMDDEHRKWLGALRTHGDMMLRLVNDLLDLGALQTGVFRLRSTVVDVTALADDCATALRPQASAKGLQLVLDVTRDAPPWVEADPIRVRQILLNLLANAVKFTERGQVRLTVGGNAAAVVFTVSDTGPGIPANLRAQLFQPFVRLDQASRTEGAGLGLALVTGLCTAMGGRVTLVDGPETGATFVVTLPLGVQAEPKSASARAETGQPFHGLRVLVAEDNTLVREWLGTILRQYGAAVETVGDGAAAVAACTSHAPDAVILDLSMPLLDGLGAARAIRQLANLNRPGPWIVGLSAHAQPQDEAAALAAGMDRFLVKPVSQSALDEVLRAAPAFQARRQTAQHAKAEEELRARLLAHYERETPSVLRDLREAVQGADWSRVLTQVHYLKNSADVLVADELRTACQALYAWAQRPDDRARGSKLLAAVEAAARDLLSTTPAAH